MQSTTTTVTETTSTLANGLFAMIIGSILIVVSFPWLWFNERKDVRIAALLKHAREVCVDLDPNAAPEESKNFKLVYASGETRNEATVLDEEFDVEVENSVKIVRLVEMYQWKESRHQEGRGRHQRTVYTYNREWCSTL